MSSTAPAPSDAPLRKVRRLLQAAKRNCRLDIRPTVEVTCAEMKDVLEKLNTDPIVAWLIAKTPDLNFETVLSAIEVEFRTDFNQSDLNPNDFYNVVAMFLIALSSTAEEYKFHIIKSLAWHLERNMHTLPKLSCDQIMEVGARLHGPKEHEWHFCSVDGPPSRRYICCAETVKNKTHVLKLLRNEGHRDPPERFVIEGYQLDGSEVSVPVTAEMCVQDAIKLGNMAQITGIRHNRVRYY